MDEQEFKEIVSLMEASGCEVLIPDTPVPYYENGVPAGIPNDMGDYDGEYVVIPRKMLGNTPMVVINVRGESMCDADIENGDMIYLSLTSAVEDGDIVVAYLDGETTLKVFYRDEKGEAWLVPQNENYEPIRMSEFTDARILGRVEGVKKNISRVSYRAIQKQMRAVKSKKNTNTLADEKVRKAIQRIAPQMTNNRQWFCIYRVLVDIGYINERGFHELRECVDRLLPNNDYCINPKDISRMSVGSFDKRLFFWEEKTAPVQGKRYNEYLLLAKAFKAMLE